MNAPLNTATLRNPGQVQNLAQLHALVSQGSHVPVWLHRNLAGHILAAHGANNMAVLHPGTPPIPMPQPQGQSQIPPQMLQQLQMQQAQGQQQPQPGLQRMEVGGVARQAPIGTPGLGTSGGLGDLAVGTNAGAIPVDAHNTVQIPGGQPVPFGGQWGGPGSGNPPQGVGQHGNPWAGTSGGLMSGAGQPWGGPMSGNPPQLRPQPVPVPQVPARFAKGGKVKKYAQGGEIHNQDQKKMNKVQNVYIPPETYPQNDPDSLYGYLSNAGARKV